MTTEDYLRQHIGQLVMQLAILQAQVEQLSNPPVSKPAAPGNV